MNNNLQALEKLKQSAKKQSIELENTITEIHSENLKDLMQSLKATHKQKSENLEKNISILQEQLTKKITKNLREIENLHERELRLLNGC